MLLVAWVIVIVAFFILAVQMFVTILEFKLTSLAGFVLVPVRAVEPDLASSPSACSAMSSAPASR